MTIQPENLRLADVFEFMRDMQRSEREAWRYADELEQERKRLHEVNQELLEALHEVMRVFDSNPPSICDTVWVTGDSPETLYDHCRAAIAKATGEQA